MFENRKVITQMQINGARPQLLLKIRLGCNFYASLFDGFFDVFVG
jgi:hypothetical protein